MQIPMKVLKKREKKKGKKKRKEKIAPLYMAACFFEPY
jgi:hypothetical protein